MAMSLGRRFARVHNELDGLRADLERKVFKRTSQLTEAVEKLSIASDAKSEFVANMSHELRTPLNSVVGFSELLLSEEPSTLGERERHCVTRIHNGGEHLVKLVDQVLDIATMESGRWEIELEQTDLASLIAGSVTDLRPALATKSLRLEADMAEDIEPVDTDPLRLKQVLINLLGNAIKFTDEGSVKVRLFRGDSGKVAVEVSDTGVGIPADKLETIFEPFEQLEVPGGYRRDGTGLGLAISMSVCEKLGAELDVTSEVGVGSTFRVTLPTDGPPRPDLDDAGGGSDPANAATSDP